MWLTTPDLCFGQLMCNFFVWLAAGEQYIDPFYLEDEEFFYGVTYGAEKT